MLLYLPELRSRWINDIFNVSTLLFFPTSFLLQTPDEEDSVISRTSFHSPGVVETSDFQYLTSEQDLTTWELLKSSPTNCNVFVGNISYKIDQKILLAAFQPFVVQQHQQHIKVSFGCSFTFKLLQKS